MMLMDRHLRETWRGLRGISYETWHQEFLAHLNGWKLSRYSDGGGTALNRVHKRAKGKAQRQARKRQRRAR